MSPIHGQVSIASWLPTTESTQFLDNRSRQFKPFLLTETALVTVAVISAVKIFNASLFLSGLTWFVAPCILVAAAFIPTAIKRDQFGEIGLNINRIGLSLRMLWWVCLIVFPITFLALWLLRSLGLELPLRPVRALEQNWLCWSFYQFMYVAVAEEVFFRGYVQSNVLRLLNKTKSEQLEQPQWTSVVISAACFATAHIIIQGQMISALIFLPGLILGWLFIRTKSLLAPILFHGLANVYYCLVAAVLS